MIGKRLPTSRWSVDDQLGTDRQSIWDCRNVNRRLKTVLGLSATTATGQRPVTNQSPTSRWPPCDHVKAFSNRFGRREVSLEANKPFATKSFLRPSCDLCKLSTTSRRAPSDPPTSSLWPSNIMVARRSPTGYKLCVTGASRIGVMDQFLLQYFSNPC